MEDGRGEFVAHHREPRGHPRDPLCGRERERRFKRCGSGIQGAGPQPDHGQVNTGERLAGEPVNFARPWPLVVQAKGTLKFGCRLASGGCGRGERCTGLAIMGGLREDVISANFQQIVVVFAVAGCVRVADGLASGIGIA